MNAIKEKLKTLWESTRMALAFAAVVFCIMLLTIALVTLGSFLLTRVGVLRKFDDDRFLFFFTFFLFSLAIGTVVAALVSRLPLKPIRKIMYATDRIADGDYSVRIHLKRPEEFRNLGEKFNHMAEELGSVEMLRNDFVNNFSHEFKTPIVSIRGFAKMLKRDDLTPEERDEYLDIIIQESQRLADLSMNVLNLSKVEQQTILTEKEQINITEQIRLAIALMDSKWQDKEVSYQMDGQELYTYGNEELLKQVWINLLDNAIKFSPDHSQVRICLSWNEGGIHGHENQGMDSRESEELPITVTIANQGVAISPESAAHIFDKFYQGDLSRTVKGNGLGLTIAKNIVKLHRGKLILKSSDQDWTIFQVSLPQ